jgi:hypothetical protein
MDPSKISVSGIASVFILKRAREVENHDGLFPMRVNNQRLFQEFALQTSKTKPKGFVLERKVKYPALVIVTSIRKIRFLLDYLR